jgi:hypothetical protein
LTIVVSRCFCPCSCSIECGIHSFSTLNKTRVCTAKKYEYVACLGPTMAWTNSWLVVGPIEGSRIGVNLGQLSCNVGFKVFGDFSE